MTSARRIVVCVACSLLAAGCPSRKGAPGAITVLYADPTGAAARAGIRAGDRLASYRRAAAPPANPAAARGTFASCAEVAEVEVEQAPRGEVELRVERGRERLAVTLPAGEWKLGVAAPPARTAGTGCADLSAGREARNAKESAKALAAYARAERWGESARRPLFRAIALEEGAAILLDRNEFTEAERQLGQALRLRQAAAPGSLAEAASWHGLGRMERLRGSYDLAESHFRKALALRARLAPDSLERAFTLNNLGIVAWFVGDRARAAGIYREARAIVHRRAPDGLEEAQILNNLGLLQRSEGELRAAEAYFRAAETILRRVDPDGTDLPRTLGNLGALAADRGNFALSESYHRQALASFRRVAPDGLEVATILNNLGWVAGSRQDLATSESLHRQSLVIRQRLAPGTLLEAESLSALANNALGEKRLDEARRLGERAYALRSRLAPNSGETSISLGILAKIALEQRDFATALDLARREAEHQREHGAMPLNQGHSEALLANIAMAQKDYATAGRHYRAALALYRAVEPMGLFSANMLNFLGRVERETGHLDRAEKDFRDSVDALEAQIGTLGGTDQQLSLFEAVYLPLYQDLADLQLRRGDPAGALKTLERSRARSLLALFARRDLVFAADLPEPIRRRQTQIDREYNRLQADVARLGGNRKREREAGRAELDRLRAERAVLAAEIARTSPRYAALSDPKTLGLAAIQKTLDPTTVYLSFALGENGGTLFVVTPAELEALPIAAGREEVGREVGIYRSLLLSGTGGGAAGGAAARPADRASAEAALRAQGRRLYDLLIAPAERWIGPAERVLVSPDGALHVLPFAALIRPDGRYLVDWKPLHGVVSATLYAELKARRAARPQPPSLAAFADPVYRAVRGRPRPEDTPLRRYNLGLPPLPASRAEAQALTALYGKAALVYTGAQASERRAMHLPPGVRIVHFAGHALLDRHFPLDSALALSVPAARERDGLEDGLLQAWEIFERLRLDADLVTLSACETGLGGAGGGEGLVGLTRAFQYAGARSILASLWSVSDRPTAELMKRFYAALRAGEPKDRALRTAQRALLRDPAFAHPYEWAGFELIGDWR